MVRLAQTVHLSCIKISTIFKQTESCLYLSLVTSEYHRVCPKWFLVLCLAQTVHLSCTDTNTVSKRTEMRFHMTHGTKVFSRVCPKRFLSLWYVWRKPCTYLASRLALSQNGPNRASPWASLPRSTIGCIQNDFWVYGTFGANSAPILH
jgi:hypothetical protein